MTRSVRRIGTAAAFALLLGAALFAQNGQRPVFRAGAVLVTVDVYPQQHGQIVEGLQPEDFEVLEDGTPQKVEDFDFVRVEPALTEEARRDPNSGREGNTLAGDPRNRVFVVFLDFAHVTIAGSHATRQPLLDALRRLLAPNDLFGVMTSKMRPPDLVFGRSLHALEDQLARYWTWGERYQMMLDPDEIPLHDHFAHDCKGQPRMFQEDGVLKLLSDVLVARLREDKLLLSLEDLVGYMGDLREARTSILFFSDGWRLYEPDRILAEQAWDKTCGNPPVPGVGVLAGPNSRLVLGDKNVGDFAAWNTELVRLAGLDNKKRFRDLIAAANRHNVTFYTVDPEGLEVFNTPLSEPAQPSLTVDHGLLTNRVQNLRTLAESTDGLAVVDNNDLTAGLRRVVDDTSAYYLLGYYSTNTKLDGGFRRIQVKLKRPGTSVRARRGYFAPRAAVINTSGKGPGAPNATTGPSPASPAGPSAVDEALGVLGRLQSSADVFTYGAFNAGELTIVAEIASARSESGKWAQGADVRAIVTGPTGQAAGTATGKIEPASRGTLLHVPVAVGEAGPWRVAVNISAGGETMEDRATIEAGPAGVLLGSPLAYRAAPGPRAPLHPVADFRFRRTERVHVEWPTLKALDARQARLLGKNGQPLAVAATLTERDVNGHAMLAVDVNLAPLGPGDYVIEVTAGSGSETARRLIAIRVEP